MIKIPCGGFYLDESLIINENGELSVNSEYIQTITKPSIVQITLLASAWGSADNTQTVVVSGVSADETPNSSSPPQLSLLRPLIMNLVFCVLVKPLTV